MTALRASRAGFNDRDSQGSLFLRFDFSIVLLSAILLAFGLVVVYSATRGAIITPEDVPDTSFLRRQVLFVAVGGFLAVVVASIDYRKVKAAVPAIYGITVLLLVGLFFFGSSFNGATSWYSFGFVTLQPSEFAKLSLIVALAAWFSHVEDRESLAFTNVIAGLAIAGVFAGLVLLQPDFGTVMVYAAIVAGIVVVGGATIRQVLAVLAAVGLGIVVMIRQEFLRETQINRFVAFVNPESTARQTVFQSEVAIGNGGLTGTGLFQGTQNNNSLVPEKETDFIFSVVGEEFGFVGGAALLILLGLLLMRIWRVAHLAEDTYGRLICVGVCSMILFQVFQTVGMNMGMMPVTGIPLPLISFGGSSMLTPLMAIGLVENVHAHRLR